MIQIDVNTYPALLSVVHDSSVRAELAHLSSSANTLLDPFDTILVGFINQLEGLDNEIHHDFQLIPDSLRFKNVPRVLVKSDVLDALERDFFECHVRQGEIVNRL